MPKTPDLDETRAFWDEQAASFDDEPDHGLRDETARDAWRRLLLALLPPAPADVVDLGCGTGTLALLLAEQGHRLRGLDLAPAMVDRARAKAKAAGLSVELTCGDAAQPPYPASSADAVLVRHVLWALPDPDQALRAWTRLLRPEGRLILVEGYWHTGGGLRAAESRSLVLRHRATAEVLPLTDPDLWGGPISDERYLLVS
jgi:ubiquinone/menaquinone biosynthesis C-methylase UbiE